MSSAGRGQSRIATEEEVLVFLFPVASHLTAWEASVQISRCLRGSEILIPAELFWGTLLSHSFWAELHRRLWCAWAGRGRAGGLVVRLLLHREGKLVRRHSSAWRKSFLLWAVVSWEGSLLSVLALLALSALRFIHSSSGRPCPVAGCLQWKGLLFAVPPAQGWLTSCLHNSFETFLFFLTSDCKASSEAIYEACYRNCTVLPDTTLHHFFSLKLTDRAAVDFFHPLKCCIHLGHSHLSQAQGARKPRAYHRQQLSGRSEGAVVLQARTEVRW